MLLGGLPPADGPLAQGYFVEPTVFAGVHNEWRIAREEIFGPVLVAIPWHDEADVVRMANDSHYGLAAYVWTHEPVKGAAHGARDRVGLGAGESGARDSFRASRTVATSKAASAASTRSRACSTATRSASA